MAAGLLARLNYHSPGGVITPVQYWTSTFCLYAIGFPLASALSYGLLSKVYWRSCEVGNVNISLTRPAWVLHSAGRQIVGPFDQGTVIGWQQVAGSVARVTGPLWAGELYAVRSAVVVIGLPGQRS